MIYHREPRRTTEDTEYHGLDLINCLIIILLQNISGSLCDSLCPSLWFSVVLCVLRGSLWFSMVEVTWRTYFFIATKGKRNQKERGIFSKFYFKNIPLSEDCFSVPEARF